MINEWLSGYGIAVVAGVSCTALASAITAWVINTRWQQQTQLLQQQAESDVRLAQSREQHYLSQLTERNQELDEMDVERDRLTAELRQMHGRLAAALEKMRHFEALQNEKTYLTEQLDNARMANAGLEADLREQDARHFEEQKAADEKISLLENAEERLRIQFESLANRLFEQKTRTVDEQNRISMHGLLGPLREQLEGFRKQVTDNFSQEARERHTLVHEINNLKQLNEQMAREAVNLTQALKGDNKAQGNWGEVVLARVLSESGLREGHEYQTQVSLENEEGKRYQPDVVVHLPQNKDVVVDAKMSLVAYERYFNADTLAEQELALSEHIASVRSHIRGLSRKDYHQLHGVESLDYVLMFIPVEPAFQAAVAADPSLIRDAMDQNIMLVSPTTLLVALRTISNLWRNERQNQNAKQIAERASKLYDKLRLFVTDMEAVGASLEKANQSYQGAMNKLVTGRGNVIRQAEGFRQLGVEVKRDITPQLVERAMLGAPDRPEAARPEPASATASVSASAERALAASSLGDRSPSAPVSQLTRTDTQAAVVRAKTATNPIKPVEQNAQPEAPRPVSQPAPTRQPSQQPVLHHTLHHTLRHAAHYGDSQRPATLTDRTDEADN